MVAPLPPPSPSATPAGWYTDPAGGAGWRWWNGTAWTVFTAAPSTTARRPRLPRWASVPVVTCAPLVLIAVGVLAVTQPLAVVAGLVPFAIVLPVLSWLDRVEPEPLASRVHAVLWGAAVAVVVALVVNSVVEVLFGEVASMVLSAPTVEEGAKGLGIYWAVRRREVDGITDGVVYAGWVAVGFAVVENMSYFAIASVSGSLVPVFIVRALLTPFAHPLFTFWIGLAIGRAVRAGRPALPAALWGYAIAVASHMLWNGSLAIGQIRSDIDETVAVSVVIVTMLLFVALFTAVAVTLVVMRRREQRRFERMWPFLTVRYGLDADESAMFHDWSGHRLVRRQLARPQRRRFDQVRAALARLSLLHERMGTVDPTVERVLVTQLDDARAELRRAR